MLTFLEVEFGGNLVQGFRAYAWRAVPCFPQIALCFLSLALRPQPFPNFVKKRIPPLCFCWAWPSFYLVCPSNTLLRIFSSSGEVLPPLENFLSKKCSGTGRYSSPLVHWPLKNFIQYFAEIFQNIVFEGLPSYQKMGGGHVVSLVLILHITLTVWIDKMR